MKHALKLCGMVLGLLLATATASLGSAGLVASEPHDPAASAMACCKTCTKGKACGNSCIARDKQCQQPPGCACDG